MATKMVTVDEYERSKRGKTPYQGDYPKPGPKTEKVEEHKRKWPKKK